jgi:hypothetical protein
VPRWQPAYHKGQEARDTAVAFAGSLTHACADLIVGVAVASLRLSNFIRLSSPETVAAQFLYLILAHRIIWWSPVPCRLAERDLSIYIGMIAWIFGRMMDRQIAPCAREESK